LEERRFSDSQFLKGSTFEEINIDFGIFPPAKAYPVYFAGDVTHPKGKKIFVGINPGYSDKQRQIAEQQYLEKIGAFDGYCKLSSDFFAVEEKGLIPYFANMFVVGLGLAYIADLHWYGGSYTRLIFHSLRAGFMVLVNNW